MVLSQMDLGRIGNQALGFVNAQIDKVQAGNFRPILMLGLIVLTVDTFTQRKKREAKGKKNKSFVEDVLVG